MAEEPKSVLLPILVISFPSAYYLRFSAGEQLIELVSPTSQREMQMQLQQEEMDLRLIEEQEESIRQLEVCNKNFRQY